MKKIYVQTNSRSIQHINYSWSDTYCICGKSHLILCYSLMLVCRIIVSVWDTFTCPNGKVSEY